MNQPDLATLLANTKAREEWSYEAMSRACGGAPTGKRLFQLINAPLKNFPDPATIQALATGTGASITDIVMASARSLGLAVTDADPDALHIAGLSDLPASMREAIAAVGREASRLTGQAANDQDASTTHTGPSAVPGSPTATRRNDKRQEPDDELELQRAARSRPRKGQKTDGADQPRPFFSASDSVDNTRNRGSEHTDDDELPENWQELAAYRGPRAHLIREREDSERGEESQEHPGADV